MHAYMHTYMHAYIHTDKQTDRQTYIHIHIYIYTYAYIYSYIHIHMFMFAAITSAHHTMIPWSQQSLEASPPASASAGSATRLEDLTSFGATRRRIPTGYCCKPNRWGWWGWDGGYIVLCLCGEDWLKHGNDAGMMAKDEDDEVVDIWMEWFSWKVWGSFLTCNGIGFQMYFSPYNAAGRWFSSGNRRIRKAGGARRAVFLWCVVRAPSPQKVSHRVNLLFHLLLQKLSFQRPDTSCDFLLQEPRGPADWKIRSWRGRPSTKQFWGALRGTRPSANRGTHGCWQSDMVMKRYAEQKEV